jgi:multidrug transporter EmrE-like cation transporter
LTPPPSKPASKRRRGLLALGLGAAIVLDTTGQLLWKLAASRLPDSLTPGLLADALLSDPLPAIVVCVFLVQLVNWLFVLERVDLSFAQPITALSYVLVFLLSALWFGEHLDAVKLLGVALVLAGVVLVGAGPSGGRDKT